MITGIQSTFPTTPADEEYGSSFYTNNPLMLVSNSQEQRNGVQSPLSSPNIIIKMLTKQLSSQRELVDKLDSEPLFEYLIQNGVLEKEKVEEIKQEETLSKRNFALLKHLEESSPKEFGLFINGLRHTGQHGLANLLDEGKRIKPGTLGAGRQKGQVTIRVQVKAVKVSLEKLRPNSKPSSNSNGNSKEWVSRNEISHQRRGSFSRRRSIELMEIRDIREDEPAQPPEQENTTCYCFCFSKLFANKKKPSKPKETAYNAYVIGYDCKPESETNKSVNGNNTLTRSNGSYIQAPNNNEFTIDNNKIIDDKSQLFYDVVEDSKTQTHTGLVKYLEQSRGILLMSLNDDYASGLIIIVICMKGEQIKKLKDDYKNGKLVSEFEDCLGTQELFTKVDIKGIKLQIDISEEELTTAEHELVEL